MDLKDLEENVAARAELTAAPLLLWMEAALTRWQPSQKGEGILLPRAHWRTCSFFLWDTDPALFFHPGIWGWLVEPFLSFSYFIFNLTFIIIIIFFPFCFSSCRLIVKMVLMMIIDVKLKDEDFMSGFVGLFIYFHLFFKLLLSREFINYRAIYSRCMSLYLLCWFDLCMQLKCILNID